MGLRERYIRSRISLGLTRPPNGFHAFAIVEMASSDFVYSSFSLFMDTLRNPLMSEKNVSKKTDRSRIWATSAALQLSA